MVSVLHKELECKVEKLKYKKVGGHAAEDQNQIRTSSCKQLTPDQPTRSFTVGLINTVYHLLVKNNQGRGA